VQLAPLVPNFLQELLEFIGDLQPADAPVPGEWRHIQVVWKDVADLELRDRMVNTFDVVNITGGQVDSSWTDADYTNVHLPLETLIGEWTSFAQGRLRHVETRYYRRAFNPMSNSKPFQVSGPPEKVFPGTAAGAGAAGMNIPNQIAATHTERTTYPHHWGRTYWPLPANSFLDTLGAFTGALVDGFAGFVETCMLAWQNAEFFPVVPVTQALKVPTRGLLTVTNVQMDNIPDVIRRRRLSVQPYKAILPPLG
jgi:hypothetical protein